MDDDAVDGARFFQTHANPVFATVDGFEHASTKILGVARISFSGTHPYFIGIFRVDGQCTNTLGRSFVENRLPVGTAAAAAPYAPGGGTSINGVGVQWIGSDGCDPARHRRWSDGADMYTFQIGG